MANRGGTEEIFNKLSEKLTLKKDGPYGVNDPGRLFYMKRQTNVGEDRPYISPKAKYISKLAELLEITDRRGKSVPHHNALTVFDAEVIPMEEYLEPNDSKTFMSALGICLYIAQERLAIQQTVGVLASYMGRANKNSPL